MTKNITRTINVTIVTGFNFKENEDSAITKENVKISIPGRLTEKEISNVMDRVTSIEHKEVKYSMPLDKFIEMAEAVEDNTNTDNE